VRLTSPSQIRLVAVAVRSDTRQTARTALSGRPQHSGENPASLLTSRRKRGRMEIGSGIGTLTRALAQHAKQVSHLRSGRQTDTRYRAKSTRIAKRPPDTRRLFAPEPARADTRHLWRHAFQSNSKHPLCVSPAPILDRLFGAASGWTRAVLMMQREVAERLIAEPGTPEYSAISVFAQYHSRVEIMQRVSRTVFYPPPEVDSAIVRFTPLPRRLPPDEEKRLFRVVRAAFGQRRKPCSTPLVVGWVFRASRSKPGCETRASLHSGEAKR
jgi:16S rRNA A1518/A1519 N6-dimethyltransferase RsmA/KsgA/DIM1 with predicted DNA glycosylase/AP lyase activity